MSYFETALQSSPELAALAGGNRLSPRVSGSHPSPIAPPAPHCCFGRKSPGRRRVRRSAPARVNGSSASWKKLVLFPNTFPAQPRPLNQQRLSTPAARVGPVELGQLSKSKREAFSSLGWRRERHSPRSPPAPHLLQFPNQTHPRQTLEERPKGATQGAWLVSPPPSRGCGRRG